MPPLSVLQIAHDHPACSSGGTEWIAHDLSRALARRGVAVRFLAASTALSRPEAEPGAIEALGCDFLLRTGAYDAFGMTRADGTAWTGALGRLLDAARPDIVHLHGLDRIGSEVVPFIRRHRPAARIVLTLHDFQLLCAADGLLVTAEGALCDGPAPDACRRCLPTIPAARHALRRAHLAAVLAGIDRFLAPSRFLRERFVAAGLPAERIAILPNAVPAGPALPGVRRGDRFAFFGNLVPHKGALVLLDAAARLAARGSRASLRLHGGFTWSAPAERAAFAAALSRAAPLAQHLGPYRRADLPALMAETDWVVVPSTWPENAPLVVLEAQRAGRPVICTGIGGMAELVAHGLTGLHAPRGDAAALADLLESAAADPALCRRLAANIRPPADLDAFAEAHLDIYRQLLEQVPA